MIKFISLLLIAITISSHTPVCGNMYEPAEIEEEVYYISDIPLDKDLQYFIYTLTAKVYTNVPYHLVYAVIRTESNFDINDIYAEANGSTSYGLFQLNSCSLEDYTEEFGIEDFLDPYNNVLCGISKLSKHIANNDGDIEKALMSYNCGTAGAKKLWKQGIYETKYTRKVMKYCKEYIKNGQ